MSTELDAQALQGMILEMKSLRTPPESDYRDRIKPGCKISANECKIRRLEDKLSAALKKNNQILTQCRKLEAKAACSKNYRILCELVDEIHGLLVNGSANHFYPSLARRKAVWERDKVEFATGREMVRCFHCSALLTWKQFTVDHLKPCAMGGGDEMDNLHPSCGSCNWDRPVEDISHQKAAQH